MKRIRKNTGLWHYLNKVGVLEKGSDEAIKQARKEYWRKYNSELKQRKRKQRRIYAVTFNLDEIKSIIETAKAKGMTVSGYICEATRADMRGAYVTPHPYLLKEVQQTLVGYKRQIKAIAEKDKKNWLGVNRNFESLEQIIEKVEKQILQLFTQAPSLKTSIEEALKTNPKFITTLTQLIQRYNDSKKSIA